jgi:DNA-binding transcriptional MocR family regulator
MRDFRALADTLAADIASGTLPSGARLPTQRAFAYAHAVAVSTASRVYTELGRRGLVAGEIGRGTFVRAPEARHASRSTEAADAPIDLQIAISISADQAALMMPALLRRASTAELLSALGATGPFGPRGAGSIAAGFLQRPQWHPDPACILFPGSGRQAIASAVAAIATTGDRIGVEPLTYPSVIRSAEQLGVRLVPLETDDGGIDVAALMAEHRAAPLAGIYIQPSVHNPLGITMSAERRTQLARVLTDLKLICIEDAVFSFLSDAVPLAAYAPNNVIYIDSLAKRLAPGTGLGFLVVPAHLQQRAAVSMRAGGWIASSLATALGLAWIEDGTVSQLSATKRADAEQRQRIAAEMLDGAAVRANRCAFHLWLELPRPWRGDTFTAAAALGGVAITPASAFAVSPGHAPNAVRIAISAPPLEKLKAGLMVIRTLLAPKSGDVAME